MPAIVPGALLARWRSRLHVGGQKPTCAVEIQRGLMDHRYERFTFLDGSSEDFGEIVGSQHNHKPWHAFWRNTGPWIGVPNVKQVEIDQSFQDNGIATATLTMDNVGYVGVAGVVGTFTSIVRGYFSPLRGFQNIFGGRPFREAQNEWYNLLDGGAKMRIYLGYGDSQMKVFTGLIDQNDIKVKPDQIIVTLRDFGQLLTDQRVFGYNKAREIPSPVTFADRNAAYKNVKVSGGARASSAADGFPAINYTREDHSYWLSDGHVDDNVTEWCEIHLSAGKYETFYLVPHNSGMEMYLSIFAKSDNADGVFINGEEVAPGHWIADPNLGVVPGGNGGFPYVKRWGKISKEGHYRTLPWTLECGDGTVLRLSFRNLGYSASKGGYRAGVQRLVAIKKVLKDAKKMKNWILVDDAADMVKWALMWAGFREWEVESFGVPLKNPATFHQSDFLIDIVNFALQQANYVFYMGQPTDADLSMGVPIFRHNHATDGPEPGMVEIRDTDLITNLEPKFTKEPLAHIIRARGAETKKSKGGTVLGGSEDKSVTFGDYYFPPWSGSHENIISRVYDAQPGRDAGVNKHELHTDPNLKSNLECQMACVLIALQMALQAWTATCSFPGFPGIELDEHMSLLDSPTGLNTRLWVASKQSTWASGDDGGYTTSVGGSLLDTPDLIAVIVDYLQLLPVWNAEQGPTTEADPTGPA